MINYKLVNSAEIVSTFLPRTMKYASRGFNLLVPKNFDKSIIRQAIENPKERPALKEGYTGFLLNNDSMNLKALFANLLSSEKESFTR
jgi:hypothetical protein